MKTIVIFIVLLFLSIFGAMKFLEIREENQTKKQKVNYIEYVKERESEGDNLSKEKYLKKLAEDENVAFFGTKEFKNYLSPTGYLFDARSLTYPKRFGQVTELKRFSPKVGKFGPKNLLSWKRYMNPPIATNPTPRMLAGKVLRNFEEWRKPLNSLADGFHALEKEGGILGMHLLRELDPAAKKLALGKIQDFLSAVVVRGRLELYKNSLSLPFSYARDLILFSNMFIEEAIEADETAHSIKIDQLVDNYILFLAEQGAERNTKSSTKLRDLQRVILENDLSDTILRRVRLARISSKEELEKLFTGLTKRKRDALGIFESGFWLTEKEKWTLLSVYVKAGVIMNYSDEGTYERIKFDQLVLQESGEYLSSERAKTVLNSDAEKLFLKKAKKMENEVYLVINKLVNRYKVAVQIAIYRYMMKNGKFPVSFSELSEEYLPSVPVNPLTSKPFNIKISEAFDERGKTKLPVVNISFQRKSFIR